MVLNLLFATFSWHTLNSNPQLVMETFFRQHVPRDRKVSLLSFYEVPPGSTRLEHLGFKVESRPFGVWSQDLATRPDWLVMPLGQLKFIEDFALFPERAKHFSDLTKFDFSKWRRIEDLGYIEEQRIEAPLPSWFPCGKLLDLNKEFELWTLLVYRRSPD